MSFSASAPAVLAEPSAGRLPAFGWSRPSSRHLLLGNETLGAGRDRT